MDQSSSAQTYHMDRYSPRRRTTDHGLSVLSVYPWSNCTKLPSTACLCRARRRCFALGCEDGTWVRLAHLSDGRAFLGVLGLAKLRTIMHRRCHGEEHLISKEEVAEKRALLFKHSAANHIASEVPARGMREGRDPFRPASLRKLGLKPKKQSWNTEYGSGVDGRNSKSSRSVTAKVEDDDPLGVWVGGIPESVSRQPELLKHALTVFGKVENITVRVKYPEHLAIQKKKSWALAEFSTADGAAAAVAAGTVGIVDSSLHPSIRGEPVPLELREQHVLQELQKEGTGRLHSTWLHQHRRHEGGSFASLCGPSQRALRAGGSFEWVQTVKKNDAIPYMEALEAWRNDDERADFWARATQEYYWRESGEMAQHRPPLSGAQNTTAAAASRRSGSRSRSRSLFVEKGKNLRPLSDNSSMESWAKRPNSREDSRRPGSRDGLSVDDSARGDRSMFISAGDDSSTLTKGAGWPWDGARRVPVERSIATNDQQAVSVDRFGNVGPPDAYESVRTTGDLANAANYSSTEQRELERYIHDGITTGGGKREESPPFTPDDLTADGRQIGGHGLGDWQVTWEEVRSEPFGHVELALSQGEDLGEMLLQDRILSSLPFSPDGSQVTGFVDPFVDPQVGNNGYAAPGGDATSGCEDLAQSSDDLIGAGAVDRSNGLGAALGSQLASQRPWSSQGIDTSLVGTPGRARPATIMTRDEAEEAYGMNGRANSGAGKRRDSVASVASTVDSEKDTAKLLERELAKTMAKLAEFGGGGQRWQSSTGKTGSNIILRSASR